MSVEELLQYVPPIARYRREPLDDRKNALTYWDEAAAGMVRLDETLHDELFAETDGASGSMIALAASNIDRVRLFLAENRRTFELLHAGVRCGQIQFPELEEEGGSIPEHAASINPAAELAQAWSILAQLRVFDGDLSAAVSELVALGEMAHIICCGKGLVMHYVAGCGLTASTIGAIQELAEEEQVRATALEELSVAIDRWIAGAGEMVQCLRVELCAYSLREIERLAKCSGLEARVDELLERHYANEPMLSLQDEKVDETVEDDGRLAWRRERILHLLEGHPAPFDKIATVRLIGQLVADRISDMESPRPFSLSGQWGRLKRAYRRSRFRTRSRLWPSQLTASWPYECLGLSEDAQRHLAELREHLSKDQWNRVQPPAEEKLDIARRRIRLIPNALGILATDALLAFEISVPEHQRRRRLHAAKAAVSDALAAAGA
jgi:hypothetical protein